MLSAFPFLPLLFSEQHIHRHIQSDQEHNCGNYDQIHAAGLHLAAEEIQVAVDAVADGLHDPDGAFSCV